MGDSVKNNHGVYVNENTGYKYEGEWCDDQPHGFGHEESAKGIYEGTFKKGLKDGKGKLIFANR